jgi:site-specific DNA-cytosine methylase
MFLVVLSLISGIGGGEVALHKLGLFSKALVVVEIDAKLRAVIWSWWKKTLEKGELILKEDVRDLTYEALSGLIEKVGKIDFIIGGSPCNNLSGNNRVSRVGLSGKESNLFVKFPRILNIVS